MSVTPSKSPVRMQDVAAAAKVSASTVSRALHDDPCISASVREKIRAIAQKLGYRPHPLVQALMTQRRKRHAQTCETIALVTSHAEDAWSGKDVCRWYMNGLKERTSQHGYGLEVFPLDGHRDDPARLARVLKARGIRGVILAFSRDNTEAVQFPVDHFSVVGLSAYFARTLVDRVHLNGFANVRLALRELRRCGYRRPALVGPERNNAIVGGFWTAAMLEEQRSRPDAECCPPLIFAEGTGMRRDFVRWFKEHRPDAIIAYKAPVADFLGVMGVEIPGEVGVAHLFGTEAEMKQTAGINGQLDQVGAAAIDLLVQKLDHHAEGRPAYPRDIFITGSWVEGPTVRAAEQ